MKLYIAISCSFLLSCGPTTKDTKHGVTTAPNNTTIIDHTSTTTTKDAIINTPSIPQGAVTGNYNGVQHPFYAHIKQIDTVTGVTTVGFEDTSVPEIQIKKTYGATIKPLTLKGFDRDLLLVTAALKDPNFNKYFLYVFRNNQWKPVMNGFAIHKSNYIENLEVIRVDPKNPNNLIRYYSVFNLDESSDDGYTWRLLEESILKENW